MSNEAHSSVVQVATPQLNVKVDEMPIAKEGISGAEQVQTELITALFESRANVSQSDACHNLFNTVELLENILSKLPIKDLLFAQSVCKTWKNCIEHSKILQQGLFFATTDLEPIEVKYDRKEFGGHGTILEYTESESAISDDEFVRSCPNICVNPLLVSAFGYRPLATYLLDQKESPRDGEPFSRPEASWKRMRVSYPTLALPDVFLPFKQKLQYFRLIREEMIKRPRGRECVTFWEETLKKRAQGVLSSACEQMQHCDTTEDLDISLKVFQQQRNV